MITAAMTWIRADARRSDLAVAAVTAGLGSLLIIAAPDAHDTGWPEVAAGVGAFVMLTLRRHHTILLLVLSMVWATVHVAVWDRPTAMIFAGLVLLATAAVRLERWQAVVLGSVMAAGLYVLGLVSNDTQPGDARAVIGIAWTAGAVGIADATRSWRRYKQTAEEQLESAVEAAEAQAQRKVSEERLVIARELHDLLAHNLSVMNVQTGAALHLLRSDPDLAEASLTVARDAGRTVLDELRDVLVVLRSTGDDDAPMSSLPSAEQIDGLVDTMRASGLEVAWLRTGVPRRLTPATSLSAYRIVQEGLTNAAKHGEGNADLTTAWTDEGLAIRIENRPTSGHDPTGAGLGLIGMRERAIANGGRLTAEPRGERFVVDAWLPAADDPENG